MPGELDGKIAIITGGASGLGQATAELFIAEGARVVIADVDTDAGTALAEQLGENAAFHRTDVSRAEDVAALVDFAVAHYGDLHIMFNNAGVSPTYHTRIASDDFADFQACMSINLLGAMLDTQQAARHMAKNGAGAIINTGSLAGTMPGWGVTAYRMSKAAVNHFTRCAAIEYGENGIRVNCINPGAIQTQMVSFREPGMSDEQVARVTAALEPLMTQGQPLQRRGQPQDIANAALYLASDRSIHVSGIALTVDAAHSAGDSFNYMEHIQEVRARALSQDGNNS
ncbi:MAG TPA: SDR family oxidoreductase [Pseudomonadaceae bacterium]|nr:SDR family oxidoreductase [Pseudomonadaceae bacterium]